MQEDKQADTIPRSYFTTEKIREFNKRVNAWRESAGFIFDVSPHSTVSSTPFHASIESYHYGSLVSSICSSVGSRWRRTPLDAARNGVDHFMVQVYMNGKGMLHGDRDEVIYDVGDIFVLDASRHIKSDNTDFTNYTLWVPRSLLEPALNNPDALHGMVIKHDNPLCAVLRSHLFMMHEQAPLMTPAQGEMLTQPTMDLLVAAFESGGEEDEARQASNNTATLLAVKRFIGRNLEAPGLGPAMIAKALNVSRATLYRICEPLGGVNTYVRQQRLKQVLKNLYDPQHNHLSIAQIAAYWGFHDPSSFNRCFRREFGMAPSDARHQRATGSGGGAVIDTSLVGDRDYEQWLLSMHA